MTSDGLKKLKSKTIRGAVWTTIQAVGGRAMGLVFFVVLARLLSPEIIGLAVAAAVFLAISEMLMEQGLGQALIQRRELMSSHCDTAFWVQFGVAMVVLVVGQLAAPWLAVLYKQPDLTPVIRALLFVTPLSALGAVHQALLNRELRFKQIAIRNLFATGVGGSIAVTLAVAGAGVWSLVAQQLTAALVGTILLWTASKWRPKGGISMSAFKDLLGFSVHLFFQRGVILIKNRADQFLIGSVLGPVQLGLYSTAFRVVDAVTSLFIKPFSQLSLPVFSKLQHSLSDLRMAYDYAVQIAFLISLPASAALFMLAPEVVATFLGAKWVSVVDLLKAFAFLVAGRAVAMANSAMLLATGNSALRLKVSIVSSLVTFGLFLAFVEEGVATLAMIYTITGIAMVPVNAWLVSKIVRYSFIDYCRAALVPSLATAAMVMVLWWSEASVVHIGAPPLLLIGRVCAAAIIYGLVVWRFSGVARAITESLVKKVRQRLMSGSVRVAI